VPQEKKGRGEKVFNFFPVEWRKKETKNLSQSGLRSEKKRGGRKKKGSLLEKEERKKIRKRKPVSGKRERKKYLP